MKLTTRQLDALLEMLLQTREKEFTCDECLERMSEFAEVALTGSTIPEGLRFIDDHLNQCPNCHEEFQALRDALENEIVL